MLAHLRAENDYREAVLEPLRPLEAKLYAEITGRIRQDDCSVPYRKRGYWYFTRYGEGEDYPVHLRRAMSTAPEEVLLDVRDLARDHEYYELAALEVSPDEQLLAYAEDTVGRRLHTLRLRNIATGVDLPDRLENVEADVLWSADSRSILYIEKDPQTLLGCRVRRHVLGTDPALDTLVYEESDESFHLGLGMTRDERYLIIDASSTVSSEQRVADADDPELAFRVLIPRELDHEYQADHHEGRWIIRTNWQAPNFRIVAVPLASILDRSQWRDVVAHDEGSFLHDCLVFRAFLAVSERSLGLLRLRVQRWQGGVPMWLEADEAAFHSGFGDNEEFDTDWVRYTYTSLTTPHSVLDFNVATGERTLLKRQEVLGDFDRDRYVTEYLRVDARDGRARIPVALVRRRDVPCDGTAPLLQHGYGAYGVCSEPRFSSSMLSLLDRGFVYAIAQVRGGQELGRHWYDDGRLLNKMNSFTDFIDVTRQLVRQGYADPRRVFAIGGSAGGLLVGAVANMAPDDYRAIIAQVPFVDVVTTMLDETIPLTTYEYDEWGNPADARAYACMLAYSPYDNVRAQDYPAMLVTAGLWDGQVQYWEPAKWVARLRSLKTDTHPILLRVDMDAGHGGKSGRLEHYREIAEEFAFLLDQDGIHE